MSGVVDASHVKYDSIYYYYSKTRAIKYYFKEYTMHITNKKHLYETSAHSSCPCRIKYPILVVESVILCTIHQRLTTTNVVLYTNNCTINIIYLLSIYHLRTIYLVSNPSRHPYSLQKFDIASISTNHSSGYFPQSSKKGPMNETNMHANSLYAYS